MPKSMRVATVFCYCTITVSASADLQYVLAFKDRDFKSLAAKVQNN